MEIGERKGQKRRIHRGVDDHDNKARRQWSETPKGKKPKKRERPTSLSPLSRREGIEFEDKAFDFLDELEEDDEQDEEQARIRFRRAAGPQFVAAELHSLTMRSRLNKKRNQSPPRRLPSLERRTTPPPPSASPLSSSARPKSIQVLEMLNSIESPTRLHTRSHTRGSERNIWSPSQLTRKEQIQRLIEQLQNQHRSHEDSNQPPNNCEESVRHNTKRKKSDVARKRKEVPDIPFGYLAFQDLSWKGALQIDLRLWCNLVDDYSLHLLAQAMQPDSPCRSLDIRGCVHVTDKGLDAAVALMPNLQVLRIAGCSGLTEAGVESVLERCGPQLLGLDLDKFYSVRLDDAKGLGCSCCSQTSILPPSSATAKAPDSYAFDLGLHITPRTIRVVASLCRNLKALHLDRQTSAANNETLALVGKHCKALTHLEIGECNGIGLEACKAMASSSATLRIVDLQNCNKVTDEAIQHLLGNSLELRKLDLSGLNLVTDNGIRTFLEKKVVWGFKRHDGFVHLKSLNLSRCSRITDVALCWITSACPNLTHLDLSHCSSLRDYGLRNVGTLKNLRTLSLASCPLLGDAALLHMIAGKRETPDALGLLKLNRVDLCNLALTSEAIEAFVEALGFRNAASLASIDLENVPAVSDALLRKIAHHLGHKLRALTVSNSSLLSSAGFGAVGKKCKGLRNLRVSSCDLFADDALSSIKNLSNVEYLQLSRCHSLTAFHSIPNWRLRTLRLIGCQHLEDQALVRTLLRCQELCVLDVSECKRVTDSFIHAVLDNLDMPPNLHTLNAHGCPLVSEGALEALAAFLRESKGTQCKSFRDETFRGVIQDPLAKPLNHQRNANQHLQLRQEAALTLQCFVRTNNARRRFQVLRQADHQLKKESATKIQSMARRMLARLFYKEMTHVLRFLATRLQFLWRKLVSSRKKAKAMSFWRNRRLALIFDNWARLANEEAVTRREERARLQMEKATKFWAAQTVKGSFSLWKEYVVQCRWEKQRFPKAINFFFNKVCGQAFRTWSANIRPAIDRRKHLVGIFLNCLPLETRNASLAKSSVYVARRMSDKRIRRHAFKALQENATQSKLFLECAIAFLRSQFLAVPGTDGKTAIGKGFRIFQAWRLWSSTQRKTREKEGRLKTLSTVWKKRRTLRRLRKLAAFQVLARQQKKAAMTLFYNTSIKRIFQTWAAMTTQWKDERFKMNQALRFLRNQRLAQTFTRWRQQVALHQSNATKVQRSLARLQHRFLWRAFDAWVDYAQTRAAFRRRHVQRLRQGLLLRVLQAWKSFAKDNKAKREDQLRLWIALNSKVVVIQARWRGVLGRAQVEDYRIMSQFMATKIQTRVRIMIAKKELIRMERKRILQEYIMAEKEMDLMALEDQDGEAMRKEYRAARMLQLHYRARKSRDWYHDARRELNRLRQIKRREEQRRMAEEHERKEKERRENELRQHQTVSKFQALFRGMLARIAYNNLWVQRFDYETAGKIQKVFRARAARLRFAALKRREHYLMETRALQRKNAKILRMLRLKNRRQQAAALPFLDRFGLHPDTFMLDLNRIRKEVQEDFTTWQRMARSHVEAFRIGRFDAEKRQEIVNAFYQRVADESFVRKGDAVKIVSRQSPYCGMSGFVLNVYNVPSVPGGRQAVVKLDENGKLIFIPVMTAPTESESSSNALLRIESMNKDFSATKVTPELVQQNRDGILRVAAKLSEEFADRKAATMMQRSYRGKVSRDFVKEESIRQAEIDKRKQEKLLRILKAFHLDSARTGRILIATGLVWPRYVPDMPERPYAIEKWYQKFKMQRELKKYRKEKYSEVEEAREGKLRLLRKQKQQMIQDGQFYELKRSESSGSVVHTNLANATAQIESVDTTELVSNKSQADLRWRVRTPWRMALARVLDVLTDFCVGPLAVRLQRKSNAFRKEAKKAKGLSVYSNKIMAGLIQTLANVVGGPEWRRSIVERRTWVGVYGFTQLVDSPHVSLGGFALFHGTWSRSGVPDGFGVLEFAHGRGMEKILAKYSSLFNDGESIASSTDESTRLLRDLRKSEEDVVFTDSDEENEAETMTRRKSLALDNTALNDQVAVVNRQDEKEQEKELDMKRILQRKQTFTKVDLHIETMEDRMRERKRKTDKQDKPLEYETIAANVEHGQIVGFVVIKFVGGATYEGKYVSEDKWKPSEVKEKHNALGEGRQGFFNLIRLQEEAKDEASMPHRRRSSTLRFSMSKTGFLDAVEEQDDPNFHTSSNPDIAESSEDEPHFGVWTTPSGTVYEGPTVTNHFNEVDVSGLLRVTWASGDSYFGDLEHSERHGEGRMVFKNGDEYKGEWKSGQPHGRGSYFWNDSRTVYVGFFRNGKPHGKGRQTFPGGAKYEGEYEEGRFHGEGRLLKRNGDLYVGSFKQGRYDGFGRLEYAEGGFYEGHWVQGARVTPAEGPCATLLTAEGHKYVVPFAEDEMDGVGVFVEKVLGSKWIVERHGLWRRGKLVHWISVSVNEGSTLEFCSHFQKYADYHGPFALIVAQMLPELPPGVDPDDRRVEQHIDGILRRAGPMVGVKVIERAQEALAEAGPQLETFRAMYVTACEALTAAEYQFEKAKDAIRREKEESQNLARRVEELERSIKDYWRNNSTARSKKRAFKRAVHQLRKADYSEWFACKMATLTPLLWDSLWKGIAKLLLVELDKRPMEPRDVEKLCNSAETNAKLGEENALIRNYHVKIIDDIDHLNIYERAKSQKMLNAVKKIVYHNDMKPNNYELVQVCGLAAPLIYFLRACFQYIKSAEPLVATVDEVHETKVKLAVTKAKLEQCIATAQEREETVRQASKEKTSVFYDIQAAESRYAEVKSNLERAIQIKETAARYEQEQLEHRVLLHKFSGKEERDEDDIEPWLSRADEYIRTKCMESIEEMLDLLCNIEPEVWDTVWTLRELVVAGFQYEERYGAKKEDADYVFPEVRDLVGSMVNQVAGFSLAELQVHDVLDEIIYRLEGPDPEVEEFVCGDLLDRAEALYLFEERARVRDVTFTGKRVSVEMEDDSSKRRFGTCLKTYDYKKPIFAATEPGTGLIFCDESTDVFGYEESCCFSQELREGDLLCLPTADGSGIVERVIVNVLYDFQLQINEPFDYTVLSGDWTKDWGFRRPDKIIDYVDCEVIDVRYDNDQEETHVLLSRVALADDEERQNVQTEGDQQDAHSTISSDSDSDSDSDQTDLIQIWEEFFDNTTQQPYYHNVETGQVTWEQPTLTGFTWFQFDDPSSGYMYWFNPTKGVTTWLCPKSLE